MRLAGKTAPATGGAAGFGAGVARWSGEKGVAVTIADTERDAAAIRLPARLPAGVAPGSDGGRCI